MKNGDIVYLTRHYSEWLRTLTNDLDLALTHRLAKIVKIFDWDTDEGKLLLAERVKNGKWEKLVSDEFKYVLNVYYPELTHKNRKKKGITLPEVLPLNYPGTELPLFEVFPPELFKDLVSIQEEDLFSLKKKDI